MTKSDLQTLRAGLAALEAAHVAPLGLNVCSTGEWWYYQFLALAGHPRPSPSGWSLPWVDGEESRTAFAPYNNQRLNQLIIKEKSDTLFREITGALWPEWDSQFSVFWRTRDGAVIYDLVITRKARTPDQWAKFIFTGGKTAARNALNGGTP